MNKTLNVTMVTVKKSVLYATKSAGLISGTCRQFWTTKTEKQPQKSFVDKYNKLTFVNIIIVPQKLRYKNTGVKNYTQ